MKKSWVIVLCLAAALISSCVTMTVMDKPAARQEQSKLDQLEHLIDERFIGEVDRTAIEDAAAAAMVAALGDEWSYYIPAAQYQSHLEQMNNAYVGIGITIMVLEEEKGFTVISVTPGGPAEEAGMQVQDIIVAISGTSTVGMTTTEAGTLVKGEENTQVVLTVDRGGNVFDLTVTRKQIQNPVVTWQMLDQNIGLIDIANFDARCFDEFRVAMEALLNQGAEGLIFDVRNNPGGYKHELVAVLDYLLPEGPLFRSEDYLGNTSVDSSDAEHVDIPMAVLVNDSSFSAAEFFAAALDEYDAAVVVGQQTYGKGYFQTTIILNDGSAVGLSVGKYTTPKGVSLAGVGITPEIVVEVDADTELDIYTGLLAPEEDPQIRAAVEALLGQ